MTLITWNLLLIFRVLWDLLAVKPCYVLLNRQIVMATKEIIEQLIKNPDKLKNLEDEAKDLALLHGIVFRMHENPNLSEVVATTQICLHCSFILESQITSEIRLMGWENIYRTFTFYSFGRHFYASDLYMRNKPLT